MSHHMGEHRRRHPERVPVPGMPSWVGHATLERHPLDPLDPLAPTVKIRPHVRVHPVRYALWWVGCRVGHATLEFWRSLYVRVNAAAHHLDEETEEWGDGVPPNREVHHDGRL